MRKQIQKDRCSKIMLSKCKSVCRLYDKVQLAAARMLDAEPSVCSFVCNVPVGIDVPADDLNLPSETYTTDFVIQYNDALKSSILGGKAGTIPPILAGAGRF